MLLCGAVYILVVHGLWDTKGLRLFSLMGTIKPLISVAMENIW